MDAANVKQHPTRSINQCYQDLNDNIITFEHINVHGIDPHDDFIELTNNMGILNTMEAGVYILVETQWGTTNNSFKKYIQTTIRKVINVHRLNLDRTWMKYIITRGNRGAL